MKSLENKRILLGVSGGIAAYKSPEIVRLITKAGGQVKVIMTTAGEKFVTRTTMETVSGNRVYSELFPADSNYDPLHISLARWSDGILVAPATANIIAKTAIGIADDLLSSILLAMDKPIFIVPSMNTVMWEHPATQKNIAILQERGVHILPPEIGLLASKTEGIGAGRMPEPVKIVEWLSEGLSEIAQDLAGRRVLVVAGPTVEEIDPVRYISNRSSGKMGFALAKEAVKRGAAVTFIYGPVNLLPPSSMEAISVRSAEEMLKAVQKFYPGVDIAIMTAAVADYRPARRSPLKIKKSERLTLELKQNPDILQWMGENRGKRYLVGFALEDEANITEARRKLNSKNVNIIALNTITAMEADECAVTLVTAETEEHLPLQNKSSLARIILDRIVANIV
jgi:phosphopantothenoylcysteine decarboxylase/phosphopantothenate--cysteine ligase